MLPRYRAAPSATHRSCRYLLALPPTTLTVLARVQSIRGMELLAIHSAFLVYLAYSQWGRRGVIVTGAFLACIMAGSQIASAHWREQDRAERAAWEACFHACSEHAPAEAVRRYPTTDAGLDYRTGAVIDEVVRDCAAECRERER